MAFVVWVISQYTISHLCIEPSAPRVTMMKGTLLPLCSLGHRGHKFAPSTVDVIRQGSFVVSNSDAFLIVSKGCIYIMLLNDGFEILRSTIISQSLGCPGMRNPLKCDSHWCVLCYIYLNYILSFFLSTGFISFVPAQRDIHLHCQCLRYR